MSGYEILIFASGVTVGVLIGMTCMGLLQASRQGSDDE